MALFGLFNISRKDREEERKKREKLLNTQKSQEGKLKWYGKSLFTKSGEKTLSDVGNSLLDTFRGTPEERSLKEKASAAALTAFKARRRPTKEESNLIEESRRKDIERSFGFFGGSGPIKSVAKKTLTPLGKAAVKKAETTVLKEAEELFKGPVKESVLSKVSKVPTKLKTSLVSEFTPLENLEKNVLKAVGKKAPKTSLTRKFEQVAGAPGKAEADIYDFRKSVVDPIKKHHKEFNQYLFLRRTADRLATDNETRKVGSWTVEKAQQGLEELKAKVGPKVFQKIEQTAIGPYQEMMDRSLRLQVESGRMSQQVYDAIKASNDFYAPFKVLKYFEEGAITPTGGGRKISSLQQLTKAISGIEESDLNLGDFLQASADSIYRSRILAEKNKALLNLDSLVNLDKEGTYIKYINPERVFSVPGSKVKGVVFGEQPRPGFKQVDYFKDGVHKAVEVQEDVYNAVQGLNPAQTDLVNRSLSATAVPFRAGVTGLNLAFQTVNLAFADTPRAALISKYGVRSPADLVRYPLELIHSMYSALRGNFGNPNAQYLEFLRSGAANSTIQRDLTPKSFKPTLGLSPAPSNITRNVVTSLPKLANAIEETSKILGLKRGVRIEKIAKLPKDQAIEKMAELVTEVRNFSGSPDFARRGKDIRPLNLLFMFLNARVQGLASDTSRLLGKQGGKDAATAWARLGTVVGLPSVGLALLNSSPGYKEDYDKIPDAEKENYFMIPTDKYFTDANGNKIREYYRIPKRETVKLLANLVESSVKFAQERDPQALAEYADSFLGNVSPVNIGGKNIQERVESVVSSTNPLIKTPVEFATGRDLFFHRDTVPQALKDVSPKYQFKPNTSDVFKATGQTTGVSPLLLEQGVKSFTGGGLNQITDFLNVAQNKKLEGRSILSEAPVFKRFFRSDALKDESYDLIAQLKRTGADRNLIERQEAEKLFSEVKKTGDIERSLTKLASNKKVSPQIIKRVVELYKEEQRGLSKQDRFVNSLPVKERADYIIAQLKGLSSSARKKKLLEYAKKGIVSKAVFVELEQAGIDISL